MTTDAMSPAIKAFLGKATTWQEAYTELRKIVLSCGLTEAFKWGNPCYTTDDENVVLIHGFKDYCALLFFKGALMKDPNGILVQQTANVQAARQIRFTSADEIRRMKEILKVYIKDAIAIEKSGAKVEFKETKEFFVPEEFQIKLDVMPDVKEAFEALTPGRQRGYLLHFAAAKQSRTREARVEKCMPKIFEGKGLDD